MTMFGTMTLAQAMESFKASLEQMVVEKNHYISPTDVRTMLADVCIDAAVAPALHFPGGLLFLWATVKARCNMESPPDFTVANLLTTVNEALSQISRS